VSKNPYRDEAYYVSTSIRVTEAVANPRWEGHCHAKTPRPKQVVGEPYVYHLGDMIRVPSFRGFDREYEIYYLDIFQLPDYLTALKEEDPRGYEEIPPMLVRLAQEPPVAAFRSPCPPCLESYLDMHTRSRYGHLCRDADDIDDEDRKLIAADEWDGFTDDFKGVEIPASDRQDAA